jgi:uncharacterized protein YdaU (DUF1376 family)
MAKDPAVLFYTSDFLTGTMTMTNEQVGKYIILLCLQHQKGHLTEKDMLKICITHDEEIFSKFEKIGDQFFNKRMQSEAEKRKSYSLSRSKNRKKKEEDIKDISETYVPHMENVNENENKDLNKKAKKKKEKPLFTHGQIIYPFETQAFKEKWEVWKEYRRQKKKPIAGAIEEQGALKDLSTLTNTESGAIAIIDKSISKGWQGLFKLNEEDNGTGKKSGKYETVSIASVHGLIDQVFEDRKNT